MSSFHPMIFDCEDPEYDEIKSSSEDIAELGVLCSEDDSEEDTTGKSSSL